MKIRLPFVIAAACFALAARVEAQEKPIVNAPASLLRLMPARAISLRWQQVSARPPVWAHLFCVPRGHSKEREQMFGEKKTGPVTRKDIDQGPSIEPSPFTLDIFEQEEESEVGWKRLSRAQFTQSKDVQEIHTRYLEPSARKGPVLLLHFGYTHWHDWEVLTYARGWSTPPAHQTFGWGGEGESWVFQKFSRAERGRLVVDEEDSDDGKIQRGVYRWNGREWIDRSQKWLVVGASSRAKSDIESLLQQKGYGEMRRSDEFPRLRPNFWVWVIARYRTEKQAREHVSTLDRRDVRASVRRGL